MPVFSRKGKKSYEGLEEFEDQFALDDMVWYKNVDSSGKGDDDINEILEHTLHTIHRFGVRGGVEGSTEALNAESDEEEDAQVEASGLSICRTPATDDDLQLRGFQDLLNVACVELNDDLFASHARALATGGRIIACDRVGSHRVAGTGINNRHG